jgi:DNA-binding NarL/FixJ family response regulator
MLILTDNRSHSVRALQDPDTALAAVVLDDNIGGPTCVLTKALAAVNHGERFVDPAIRNGTTTGSDFERLSDRELEVLSLVADGLSNKEVVERLHSPQPPCATTCNR